jgi:site-specific recombinase XerD
VQQIVKEIAEKAKIKKRVHRHLLCHSVATMLLERGMLIRQM